MNFNLTMPNKFLHLGFGENSTRGNGSEMTFCDSDLIEWSHTHELFTCIGIALVAFSCVGNSVAIIFIARNSSLHTPTYTGIACLALCDLIAAIFRFLKFRSHAIYIIINGCVNKGQFIMDDTLSILSFFTLNSSYFHLIMVSVVRYKLISRPFKTYVGLDCRRVVQYSIVCWGLSVIASIGYGLKVLTISHVKNHESDVIEIAFVVYLFSITIVPLLTIHILKIRKLRKALVVNKRQEVRMHTMMAVISTTTVACIVPIAGLQLNKALGDATQAPAPEELFIQGQLSQICLALNHALHPILYFMLSEVSKKMTKPLSQNDVIKKCLLISENSRRLKSII